MTEAIGEAHSSRESTTPDWTFCAESVGGSTAFWISKRLFDVSAAVCGLPLVFALSILLLLMNPVWNPGPLFFRQERMSQGCGVMMVWKFRTMCDGGGQARGPEDPVEADRITPLGHWLRRTRLDEVPQLFNVLLGQMSLIGPRPDAIDHARAYLEKVPDYAKRYALKPGISGLAQVKMGYAEGSEMAALKTGHDLSYIRNAGWWMEVTIVWQTIVVMAGGFGAR